MAGLATPPSVQGRSFLPLLQAAPGAQPDWRTFWVYEYFNEEQYMHIATHLAVVTPQYKYLRFPEGPDLLQMFSGEDLLFDLVADPYELTNLADLPEFGEVLAQMKQQLHGFADSTHFRYYPLDPARVNQRIVELFNDPDTLWFKARMETLYPDGYPGWQNPVPQDL